jgi:hypothetical protein
LIQRVRKDRSDEARETIFRRFCFFLARGDIELCRTAVGDETRCGPGPREAIRAGPWPRPGAAPGATTPFARDSPTHGPGGTFDAAWADGAGACRTTSVFCSGCPLEATGPLGFRSGASAGFASFAADNSAKTRRTCSDCVTTQGETRGAGSRLQVRQCGPL